MAPSISARDECEFLYKHADQAVRLPSSALVAWEDLSWLVYLSPFVYHTAKIMQFPGASALDRVPARAAEN